MTSELDEVQESEYELRRKQKIKENNEILKTIFGDVEHFGSVKQEVACTKSRSPYMRKRKQTVTPLRRNPKRGARSYHSKETEDGCGNNTAYENRLMVHWVGPLTKKRRTSGDSGIDDVVDDTDELPRRRPRTHLPHVVRPVSDFTEEDLLLVAEFVSEKCYDSVNGTSCHQCRQKTDDLKTVCRSESCIGIRGQFCGPCLRNRYGESVKEAIMDPNWICPPCRNICNCSFCMVKRGRRCTGQMIRIARQNGYADVKSFIGD